MRHKTLGSQTTIKHILLVTLSQYLMSWKHARTLFSPPGHCWLRDHMFLTVACNIHSLFLLHSLLLYQLYTWQSSQSTHQPKQNPWRLLFLTPTLCFPFYVCFPFFLAPSPWHAQSVNCLKNPTHLSCTRNRMTVGRKRRSTGWVMWHVTLTSLQNNTRESGQLATSTSRPFKSNYSYDEGWYIEDVPTWECGEFEGSLQ